MYIEINPTLKPLIYELKEVVIGDYLASVDFERVCNTNQFEETWDMALKHIQKNTRRYFPGDYKSSDSQEALILLLDSFFKKNDKDSFYRWIYIVLDGFIEWCRNKEINLTNILKDLANLQMNEELLSKLKNHYLEYKSQLKITFKSSAIVEIVETVPTFEEKKKNCRTAIADANTLKVIKELTIYGLNEGDNESILLVSRWNQNSKNYSQGVITYEVYDTINAQINKSILVFIDNLQPNTEGYS